jgi:hypothetical protein
MPRTRQQRKICKENKIQWFGLLEIHILSRGLDDENPLTKHQRVERDDLECGPAQP